MIDYFRQREFKSYLLLYIIAITGARFSEVNNLNYSDVKMEYVHLRGTKTVASDRKVSIDERNIQYIKQRLHEFPHNISGKPFNISHAAATKSMKQALKDLNIKQYKGIHALRHTHCSYLLSQKIPIEYISKRLGHSSITMTLNVYSHLLDETKTEHDEVTKKLFI